MSGSWRSRRLDPAEQPPRLTLVGSSAREPEADWWLENAPEFDCHLTAVDVLACAVLALAVAAFWTAVALLFAGVW